MGLQDIAGRVARPVVDRVTATAGLVDTMVRAGVIAPLRPDKYLRIAAAMARCTARVAA